MPLCLLFKEPITSEGCIVGHLLHGQAASLVKREVGKERHSRFIYYCLPFLSCKLVFSTQVHGIHLANIHVLESWSLANPVRKGQLLSSLLFMHRPHA